MKSKNEPKENENRVECAFKKMEAIENLKPNPRNPNTHPEEQITKLAKLIQLHGWRLPITVSNRSGFIVAGHGRHLAALKLGLKEVPIDTQDFQNDAEELAVLVSDNVVADLATFDDFMMGDILRELGTLDVDMEAFTALDADQINDYMNPEQPAAEGLTDDDAVPEPPKVAVTQPGDLWLLGVYWECDTCGKRYTYEDGKVMVEAGKECDCGNA